MIKLIADSSCEFSKAEAEEYGVEILPITIIEGDIEYRDRVDITPEEIYKKMREGTMYKTSALVPFTFYEKFKEFSKEYDEIVYLGFSAALSRTFNSSEQAKEDILKENPNLRIELVDTKTTSAGYKMIVLKAAEMVKAGATLDEILEEVNKRIDASKTIFSVDDMKYLYNGGRVSKTQAVIGGMLNIKPILHVAEDGSLEGIDKVRGTHRAYQKMIDILKSEMKDDSVSNQVVGIIHSDNLEGAEKIKDLLIEELGIKEFIETDLAPVIGCHTGPELIGISFYNRQV